LSVERSLPALSAERILADRRASARLLFHLQGVERMTGEPRRAPVSGDLEAAMGTLAELPLRRRPSRGSREGRVDCAVADDHPIVSRAVCDLLAQHGITVVGCAPTGLEAVELIEARRPAAALVDLRLPGLDGATVARRLGETAPETGIILYTGVDPLLLGASLDSGARGFLLKEAPLGDLPRAVIMVARGEIYLDPGLASFLVRSPAAHGLDARELAILRLLSCGLSAEEIAGRLFFSPEAVRGHLRAAMAKLKAQTRSQAVATAMRERLIS
jgi:two-component system response regulator DesR